MKGLEQCLCKVVTLGTESEVKAVMNEMCIAENESMDEPPPQKKARNEPSSRGKENHTPHSGQAKGITKREGKHHYSEW